MYSFYFYEKVFSNGGSMQRDFFFPVAWITHSVSDRWLETAALILEVHEQPDIES